MTNEENASRRTVTRLANSERIEEGDQLRFTYRNERFAASVNKWVDDDPRRGIATWHKDSNSPLEWAADGKRYSITGLTRVILQQALGKPIGAVRGPLYWTKEGESLVEMAAKSEP